MTATQNPAQDVSDALTVVNDAANDARHRGDYDRANALVRARVTLYQAARELQQEPPRNEWKEAVINELIVSHIYRREHDTDPRKAIQDAITWNCQVALDPNVSSDAAALVERGKQQAQVGGHR